MSAIEFLKTFNGNKHMKLAYLSRLSEKVLLKQKKLDF